MPAALGRRAILHAAGPEDCSPLLGNGSALLCMLACGKCSVRWGNFLIVRTCFYAGRRTPQLEFQPEEPEDAAPAAATQRGAREKRRRVQLDVGPDSRPATQLDGAAIRPLLANRAPLLRQRGPLSLGNGSALSLEAFALVRVASSFMQCMCGQCFGRKCMQDALSMTMQIQPKKLEVQIRRRESAANERAVV